MLFEDTDESATEAAELFSFGAPPPPPAGPPPAAAAPAPAPAPAPAELPEVAPPAPTSGAGDFFGSAWGAGAWAGVKGVRQAVQGTLMQTLGEPSHSTSKGDDSHQPNHHQQQQIQHEVLEDEKEVELRLMVQPLTVPGTPVSEKLIALRRLTELLEGPSRPPLRYLGFLCEPLVEALTDAGLLDKFYAQSVMAALTSALSTEDINELGVEFVNLGVVEGLLTLLSPKYELTRIGIVALLIRLVRHKDTRSDVQLRVQRYPAGMQAIVDMLDDGWEEIRNACLSLLSSLLRMDEDRDDECPSSDLQSFIAFAEGYEKLFSIAGQERESALSVRCLTVVRATLVGNPMTEKLFVSGGHVSVLVSFVTFSGHDLLGGSAAGFVEDVSLDGSVSQETTDSVSEGGLGGLQLSILRQEQALAAVRILRCIGQSESRATVTHTPGLMPALCELAFSTFDESANQHQGRSWSAYGLREAVCSEARRALASLLRDCAKAQVAFSLSCVEGVPEVTPVEGRPDGKPGVFFSADGQPYRISPSMSEPKIALEALVAGILHGPVDGKIADEAVAIFDAFIQGNGQWCLQSLMRVKQLHVMEAEGKSVPPAAQPGSPSRRGLLGTILGGAGAQDSDRSISQPYDKENLQQLGLVEGDADEVEVASVRSSLALSGLFKAALLATDSESTPASLLPTAARLLRHIVESCGSDSKRFSADIPILACRIGVPTHRRPHLPALEAALHLLMEGYGVASRCSQGKVSSRFDEGPTRLLDYLIQLSRLLISWVLHVPGLAVKSLGHGGSWGLLEALAGTFSDLPDCTDATQRNAVVHLNAMIAALVGSFLVSLPESPSEEGAISQQLFVNGVRRRVPLDKLCIAISGATALEGGGELGELMASLEANALHALVRVMASHGHESDADGNGELEQCKSLLREQDRRIRDLELQLMK